MPPRLEHDGSSCRVRNTAVGPSRSDRGGTAGAVGGFYVGGVGGAILGAPVGFIVGFVFIYSLPAIVAIGGVIVGMGW